MDFFLIGYLTTLSVSILDRVDYRMINDCGADGGYEDWQGKLIY
jgi:hypothetical protein